MNKKKNCAYIDIQQESIIVSGDLPFAGFGSLDGYSFLETTLKMLNYFVGEDIYTKSSFIESVILDFDDNKIVVKRQTDMSPVEDEHIIDNFEDKLSEYSRKKKDINEDEEIDKIYQILKYKNEESQRMIDNFFLKKKSLFMLYDKLKNAEKNLKIRYRSLGLEKEYRELDEMIKEFNIEEILEIYTDITEDNIDEYLEEGTYDVANAFQFLDMVNSRLSEMASLVMVKTMMIDRELEERKVS